MTLTARIVGAEETTAMKNEVIVTVKEVDSAYSSRYSYHVDIQQSLNMTGGTLVIDKSENREELVKQFVNSMVKHLSEDLGKQLAIQFKKDHQKQINADVKDYLSKHKKAILKKLVAKAQKEALRKIEDVEDYYG